MTQTIQIAADDTLSPVRALRSLTSAQADQIVAGLSSLAGTWDIERHESCDGQLSLLARHTGHDDTILSSTATRTASTSASCSATRSTPASTATPTTGEAVAAIKAIAAAPAVEPQRHTG